MEMRTAMRKKFHGTSPARSQTAKKPGRPLPKLGATLWKKTPKTRLYVIRVARGAIRDHAQPKAVPLKRDFKSRWAKFQMSER
jgi:hypothetical protein